MCEKSKNNYLDGDVVWVKLGSSWWPGQVVGLDKLPKDIQSEFPKKPLVAAVKFFQEESFEFVKNHQQIHEYSCSQKEEFIKKGLDKFRSKSKDNSNYMAKFPKDVKTAEILTNGDPNIISSQKFNREKKPDISRLFGERKTLKKKRVRDETLKKSNDLIQQKVTHHRFTTENDHEIRIRKQPVNQSARFDTVPRGIYPCPQCGFTATRVNVIICHIKGHKFNNDRSAMEKLRATDLQQRGLPKRKYLRKSITPKNKSEVFSESGKRKKYKPMQIGIKKMKSDPELKDKLLADWNVDSDEDDITDLTKPICFDNSLDKQQFNENSTSGIENPNIYENLNVLEESSKLLKEPGNFSKSFIHKHNFSGLNDNEKEEFETMNKIITEKSKESLDFQKITFQNTCVENDKKKSKLSCFDFEEEDISETSISNVKKLSKGDKNISIKKEIIKEFETNQVLQIENALENVNNEISSDGRCNTSSFSRKKEVKSEKKNDNIKVISAQVQEAFETQVEIVEILEIRKEYEEKLVKSELTDTILNTDLKMTETSKFENADDSFLKKDNYENFLKANIRKDKNIIDSTSQDNFFKSCKKNNSESVKNNSNDYSNNDETNDMSLNKVADDFIHLRKDFDEGTSCKNESTAVNSSFCSVEPIIEKINSDETSSLGNSSLSLQDNLNLTIRKKRGRPKKVSTYISATSNSLQDCSKNNYNKMNKTNENILARNKVFAKAESSIDKIPTDNTCTTEHVQKQSTLDHKDEINSEKSIKNDLYKASNISKAINNDKNFDESNKSNIPLDDFNNSEKSVQSLDEELSKFDQNTINILQTGISEIKKVDLTLTAMHEKTIIQNTELDISQVSNKNISNSDEVSSKSNYNLSISESSNSKEEMLDDEKTTWKDTDPPLDKFNNLKNDSSKTENFKKEHYNKNKSFSQNKIGYLGLNQSPLKAQESKIDIGLNKVNTVSFTKTFEALANSKINSLVEYQDSTNLRNTGSVTEENKIKLTEHTLLINKEKIERNFPKHNNFENNYSNPLVEIENKLLISNEDSKQSSDLAISTTSSTLLDNKAKVPVKKREKPRIIENVALKEPMILKKKLSESHLGKIRKHKFEISFCKSHEIPSDSKAKIIKLDNVSFDTKNESSIINIDESYPTTINAVKIFPAEEGSIMEIKKNTKDEPAVPRSCGVAVSINSQTCTQQIFNDLDNTELDIDSMPLVLSEDVLTPESIEHIPVLMSTASSATPIKLKDSMDISTNDLKESTISLKKRSGTPAILKSKTKVKPTITSIKTIMPQSNAAINKGIHSINDQILKSSLRDQKIFGKYVIVQTSGHQEAYSTHRKLAMPVCKNSGNAQIVQQGGKVVILTSPQSGPPKQNTLPFSTIKALNTGKIKKVITPFQVKQINRSASSNNFTESKAIPISKIADPNMNPTASEIASQKMNSAQQCIASKNVSIHCTGNVAKSEILKTTAHSVITKSSVSEQISKTTFLNKSSITPKNFESQKITAAKNVPSQTNQSFPSRTFIPSHSLISKGTVLTPITGSQVRALAAKNVKAHKKQAQFVDSKNQKSLFSSTASCKNTNVWTNFVVSQQNKNEEEFSGRRKQVVDQTIKSKPVALGNQSQFPLNTHKAEISLSDQKRTIINDKNVNYSAVSDSKSDCDLLINNNATKLKKELDEKVAYPSIIDNRNIEIHEESFSSTRNSPLMPRLTGSPKKDVTKLFGDSTDPEKKCYENIIFKSLALKKAVKQIHVKENLTNKQEYMEDEKDLSETQVVILPSETNCDSETYILVTVDEEGNIVPLDNSTLVSIDALSTQENRTLYVDPNSLNESKNVNDIVLQMQNESSTNIQFTSTTEFSPVAVNKSFSVSNIVQTTNHDILAAALANTDFQQDIGIANTSSNLNNSNQTCLINQTILQSTIIPPAQPITSPLVLETSLTLNQPIMTPLEVQSNLSSQSELAIYTTKPAMNENTLGTSNKNSSLRMPRISMLESKGKMETVFENASEYKMSTLNVQSQVDNISSKGCDGKNANKSETLKNSFFPSLEKVSQFGKQEITASMPILDETFTVDNRFDSSNILVVEQDVLRRDSLQKSDDREYSNDAMSTETCLQLETGSEKLESIYTAEQNTPDATSGNNCSVDQIKSIVIEVDNNVESVSKIGPNPLTYGKQVQQKLEENTENVEYRQCTITDMGVKEELLYTGSRATKDDLTTNKVSIREKVHPIQSPCNETTNNGNDSATTSSSKHLMHKLQEPEPNQKTRSSFAFDNINCKLNQNICSDPHNQPTIPFKCDAPISTQSTSSTEKFNMLGTKVSINHEIIGTETRFFNENSTAKYGDESKINEASSSLLHAYETFDEMVAHKAIPNVSLFTKVGRPLKKNNEFTDHCETTFSTQNFESIKLGNSFLDVNIGMDSGQEESSTLSRTTGACPEVIGTVSVLNSTSGLNEDETASSSYVPETPENQERDQDQESAVSTSSYEILPCEELNIASSNVTPDTSLHGEFSNSDSNGINIDIPDMSDMTDLQTPSYDINSDSSVLNIGSTSTSNFNDQVVMKQNILTSPYEISIPIVHLEDSASAPVANASSNTDTDKDLATTSTDSQSYSNSNEKERIPTFHESESELVAAYYDPKLNAKSSGTYYSRDLDAHLTSKSSHLALQNDKTTSSLHLETPRQQCSEEDQESSQSYVDSYSSANYTPNMSLPSEMHNLVEIPDTTKSTDR